MSLDRRIIKDPFDIFIDNTARFTELYLARDCAPPKARDEITLEMVFVRDAARKALGAILKGKHDRVD